MSCICIEQVGLPRPFRVVAKPQHVSEALTFSAGLSASYMQASEMSF